MRCQVACCAGHMLWKLKYFQICDILSLDAISQTLAVALKPAVRRVCKLQEHNNIVPAEVSEMEAT